MKRNGDYGKCDRKFSCINYKGNYINCNKANYRGCTSFIKNKIIKILIAENNISHTGTNRLIKDAVKRRREINWTGRWPSLKRSESVYNRNTTNSYKIIHFQKKSNIQDIGHDFSRNLRETNVQRKF